MAEAGPGGLPERTPLPAAGEAAFDRLADLTRRVLGVPVALVSLVDRERQAFPGVSGLAEPWATRRETPLSHSFCQYVVSGDEPLIVSDARRDSRLAGNAAITDLGVVAYAGMPLRDSAGRPVGSLCAIDAVPREWTSADLAVLAGLAAACTTELRLREAVEQATDASRRTRALIEAMPVGLITFDDDGLVTTANAEAARAVELSVEQLVGANLWQLFPAAAGSEFEQTCERVRRTGETAYFEFYYPAPLERWYENRVQRADGGLSVFFVDVSARHEMQALRERQADHDRTVARTLQQSLLTALPDVRGARLAARYLAAEGTEQVGGDWYDAVVQPGGELVVSVGDVCGHGIDSAAVMGQLRSMLRAFVWDDTATVAGALSRLDRAARGYGDAPLTTLVSGRVAGLGGPRVTFVWSNAGHPPPLLLGPDGTVTRVEARPELMLGVEPSAPRTDHVTPLPAGSTLVLYTDGLVETRGADLDDGVARLAAALARHRGAELEELLDRTLADLHDGPQEDDIAVLAIRVCDADGPAGTR